MDQAWNRLAAVVVVESVRLVMVAVPALEDAQICPEVVAVAELAASVVKGYPAPTIHPVAVAASAEPMAVSSAVPTQRWWFAAHTVVIQCPMTTQVLWRRAVRWDSWACLVEVILIRAQKMLAWDGSLVL